MDKQQLVQDIAGYPRVSAETFAQSFLLHHIKPGAVEDDNKAVSFSIIEESIRIKQTGESYLPGSLDKGPKVPVYDVAFETEDAGDYVLSERYAFLGFGSNSSLDVLAKKFGPKNFNGDPLCPVLMTELKNHSVVESAFVGAAGSVPVTLFQTPGVDVRLSLSFYRASQVERMNATEPNYDVVLLNNASLRFGNSTIECQPLAYESIWGAMLNKQGNLMRNDSIPHSSNRIMAVSTMDAMRLVYDYMTSEKNLQDAWFRSVGSLPHGSEFEDWVLGYKGNALDGVQEKADKLEIRMAINSLLMQHAIERNLDATIIAPATLSAKREELLIALPERFTPQTGKSAQKLAL